MPITKPLKDKLNGFKVIKDLGREENGMRYALVNCKECGNEFKTSVYHINTIDSCGCLPCRPAKILPKNINGFRILKDFGYSNGSRRALVICKVCEKEYEVDPNKLKYRHHCGCLRRGVIACKYAKSHPRLTQIYKHMMARCYRKNSQDYYLYGERGIIICKEWLKDRNEFCKWSLKNGYRDDLTIDRIDSNDNYEPDNCRWSNSATQARNTSRNVLTMEKAKKMRKQHATHLKLMARNYRVSLATVYNVINRKSWIKA